jgi:hypothetical protein
MIFHIIKLLFTTESKPLGRWFNVGSNQKIDINKLKEESKKRRQYFLNNKIDPYYYIKNKS